MEKIRIEFEETQKLKKKTLKRIFANANLKKQLVEELKINPNRDLANFILKDTMKRRIANELFNSDHVQFAAYLLAIHQNPEDVFLIWETKHLDFDLGSILDQELFVGAGLEQTLSYLKGSNHKGAKRIANYILTDDEDKIQRYKDYYQELPWYI